MFVRDRPFRRRMLVLVVVCAMLLVGVEPALAALPRFTVDGTVTQPCPGGVAIADVNKDGHGDLLVTNNAWCTATQVSFSVLLGNGDGTFGAPTTYSWGLYYSAVRKPVVHDLNADGNLDVLVPEFTGNTVAVFLGNGDGTFQTRQDVSVGAQPEAIVVGDFNGDGRMDFVVGQVNTSTTAAVVLSLTGGFDINTVSTGVRTSGITAGDFDLDGDLDLAISSSVSGSVSILLNDGTGDFGTPDSYGVPGAMEVMSADFNADAAPDLVVAGQQGISVLLGNGDGTFASRVIYGGEYDALTSLAVDDFNTDGNPDVAVLSNELINESTASDLRVFTGRGDGTFADALTWRVTPADSSNQFDTGRLAVGQLDGNARPDFAIASYDSLETISIVLNSTPDTVTHTVTLSASPDDAGIVLGGGTHEEGTFVTVSATPNEGWELLGWREGSQYVSADPTYTLYLGDSDRSLVAQFQAVLSYVVTMRSTRWEQAPPAEKACM